MTTFGKFLVALVVLCLVIALIIVLWHILFWFGIGLLALVGIIVLAGTAAMLLRVVTWVMAQVEHLRLKQAERRLAEAKAAAEAWRIPLIPEGYVGARLASPAEQANLVIWGGRGWATKALETTVTEVEADPPALPPPVVRFSDIAHQIGQGQMLIGIRPADGSLRLGTWAEHKTILILGKSSSGKTTTMTEKVVEAAKGGAALIICDPHGHKDDSLLRKISPLAPLCFPGTSPAIQHRDIYRNVRQARAELQRRVDGGAYDQPLLLVVEEWNRLQRDEEVAEEVAQAALEIGQEGRGFGVYAIFGAQTMTGFAQVRRALISAIVHRVDEAEARRVIPGRYAKLAQELPVGLTYVLDADGQTELLRQPLITAQDIASVATVLINPTWQMPPLPEKTVPTRTYDAYAAQYGVSGSEQPTYVDPAFAGSVYPSLPPVPPPPPPPSQERVQPADIQAFQEKKKQQKKRYTEAERQEVLRLYFEEKVPKSRIHKLMGRETDFYYDVRDIIDEALAQAEAQGQPDQADQA
jgi:hypothetical protein